MLLSTLAAALLSATVTNTETVHDLAAYDGHVVACTEGGLELFTRSGRPVRTLTVEDGLPSHFCRALEVAGDTLFAATDEGVVAVDKGWRVEPVVGAKWHALPAVGSMNAEPYLAALVRGTMYGLGLHDGQAWTQLAYGGRNPVALGKLSVLTAVARTEGGLTWRAWSAPAAVTRR
jgi:hypothetical protein